MKVSLLGLVILIFVVACSSPPPRIEVSPTPNIEATVEARLAEEREAANVSIDVNTPNPTNTPEPVPTDRPTIVPTHTPVPTPIPYPLPTPIPVPTSKPVYSSCEGKTIRFKIGNVWANETIVWTQGGADVRNLTNSSANMPLNYIISWPLSSLSQRAVPHVVIGSVNAADGTSISAWYGDRELATTNSAGGSYSLVIDQGNCVSTIDSSVSTPKSTPPPTPMPPTTFEGGFVMILGAHFRIGGEISFKIGGYVAEQTVTVDTGIGELQFLDLYATSANTKVPNTVQTRFERGGGPPNVIAGRAYIDGAYAPDGTVVTAWIGGEEIIEFRTTVVNNPTAVIPTDLVAMLGTYIPLPSPLPTPCPKYMNCGQQYYSGLISDDIEVVWGITYHSVSGTTYHKWWFYSTDPAWSLANNHPDVVSDDGGYWVKARTDILFDNHAGPLESLNLVKGWNSPVSLKRQY